PSTGEQKDAPGGFGGLGGRANGGRAADGPSAGCAARRGSDAPHVTPSDALARPRTGLFHPSRDPPLHTGVSRGQVIPLRRLAVLIRQCDASVSITWRCACPGTSRSEEHTSELQ